MKIRHKMVQGVEGEAMFRGTIVHLPEDTKEGTKARPEDIIEEIVGCGDEGVIFTGEWHRKGKQLMAMMKEIDKHPELQTMIYTQLDIDDFMFEMGFIAWNIVNNPPLKRKEIAPTDKAMVGFIGSTLLEYYLTSDIHDRYWIMVKHKGQNRVYQLVRSDDDGEITEEPIA